MIAVQLLLLTLLLCTQFKREEKRAKKLREMTQGRNHVPFPVFSLLSADVQNLSPDTRLEATSQDISRPPKGSKKWNPHKNKPITTLGKLGIIGGFNFLDP